MTEIKIPCMKNDDAELPVYKTAGAAGSDVCACITEPVVIHSMQSALIPTGLFFEIPEGYEIQVRPRSGLAFKNSITVLNTPGTIDSDYRGELKVLLMNFGKEDFTVQNKDRIAQIVVAPVTRGLFSCVKKISSTERGEGGFGSTGK